MIWKDTPKYEDLYQVSSCGEVRSKGTKYHPGRILRQSMNEGYKKVTLCKGGCKFNARVNQLVGFAFIGPRPKGQVLMHLDDIKINNDASNLRYGSQMCNEAFKVDNGTAPVGEKNPSAKLTWVKVKRIREFLSVNISMSSLSELFDVSKKVIWNIKHNKSWVT